MLRSMTGFGAAAVSAGGAAVRVEVRSVNHRHLQVKSRLPAALSQLEPSVEAAVRGKLTRGAVTVGIEIERAGAAGAPRVDVAALRAWRAEIARAAKQAGVGGEPGLESLLRLPGVIAADESRGSVAELEQLALRALDKALAELTRMREREGRALAADLRKHAKAIDALARKLGKRMPAAVREQHAALQQRLAELLDGARGRLPSDADLAREIAVLADRMDVSEELARLASHMQQLEAMLVGAGPAGRPLDFLVQEILREANTIGSKCNDAAAAHLVVEMKSLVERLREQVQNVE
jgi:uncharacterized protein (TIGR00255 family)